MATAKELVTREVEKRNWRKLCRNLLGVCNKFPKHHKRLKAKL